VERSVGGWQPGTERYLFMHNMICTGENGRYLRLCAWVCDKLREGTIYSECQPYRPPLASGGSLQCGMPGRSLLRSPSHAPECLQLPTFVPGRWALQLSVPNYPTLFK
jgi:hypothetical protein